MLYASESPAHSRRLFMSGRLGHHFKLLFVAALFFFGDTIFFPVTRAAAALEVHVFALGENGFKIACVDFTEQDVWVKGIVRCVLLLESRDEFPCFRPAGNWLLRAACFIITIFFIIAHFVVILVILFRKRRDLWNGRTLKRLGSHLVKNLLLVGGLLLATAGFPTMIGRQRNLSSTKERRSSWELGSLFGRTNIASLLLCYQKEADTMMMW